MKVVLLERVEKLGRLGDVVTVKAGYGRNFLLPQKKAIRATAENIAYFEKQKAEIQARSSELKTKAEGIATLVEKAQLIVIRQASEAGNLYGSVSSRDISNSLNDHKIDVSHTMVKIDHPIKTVGIHKVKVVLHPEVITHVQVSVAPSEEEAKALIKNPKTDIQDHSVIENAKETKVLPDTMSEESFEDSEADA